MIIHASLFFSFIFSMPFWKNRVRSLSSAPVPVLALALQSVSLSWKPSLPLRVSWWSLPPPGERLYSLDLVRHHHRVLLADLGGGLRLVVVRTVVLVRVPVDSAKQVATATVEAWWVGGGNTVDSRVRTALKLTARPPAGRSVVGKKNLFWSLLKIK